MTLEFLVATGIGWVVAVGVYLMLRGRSFTVVLGLTLLGYAVNVFIFSMGRLGLSIGAVVLPPGIA